MRIGILGGSFDPIHVGHAIIASYIMRHTSLEQLWLMVTPENPWKEGQLHASELHRLRMTELVTRHIEGVTTSAFEMQLPRPSYSVDTLRALRERFPQHEFVLVIGADNWVEFDRWRDYEEILRHHHVMVYPRLGYDIQVPDELQERVTIVQAPIIEVSSTMIRLELQQGHDATFYVTDEVNRYIVKNHLYMPQ